MLGVHEDTAGEYLLVEAEMLAGGGNALHIIPFDEEFTAIEGKKGIGLNRTNPHLQPGESCGKER